MVVVDDINDYRDDRYATIALWDDDPDERERKYVMMLPGYNPITNPDRSKIFHLDELTVKLEIKERICKKRPSNDVTVEVILGSIFTYGGVNWNVDNGNWRGFIKLN